ncbi:MAG TPA: class I adenylate-forming enzyme family protein [Polyangiaceae bacterium]|nr:class I adenylate-forming enzyme family protein [Polyangiaceae bacterium]
MVCESGGALTLSLFTAAREAPTALALSTGTSKLCYDELAERVERVARSLWSRRIVGDSEPVAVVARPTLASIEVLHALVATAAPIVLVHPSLPAVEQNALAERSGARSLLRPDDEEFGLEERAPWPGPTGARSDDAALAIVPTSGSTGQPKLVVLSQGAFAASARASAANIPLAPGDRWLMCLPPAHVGGFSILTRSLLAKSAVVLFDPGPRGLLRALPELAERLLDEQVTVLSLVPAVLDALLTTLPDWRPPPSLRAVLIGGAAVPESLLARARARAVPLLTTYGLTEACSQVTTTRRGEIPSVRDGVVSSGFALPGVELEVRDRGRICVRSPALCSGYLGATAPIDENGWFETEDRGYIDERGELYVLGRISELIVSGGENVDPLRVEAALTSCPGVLAALVFGVPDERYGEVVACCLIRGEGFDLGRVSATLRQRLSRFELPRRLAVVEELPTLPNGKVDRPKARAFFADRLQPFEHPRS